MGPMGKQCHVKVTLEWKRRRERPPACWRWQNKGDNHPPVWEHSHSRPHLPTPFGISPPQGNLWPSLSSSSPGLLSTVRSQLKLPLLTSDRRPFRGTVIQYNTLGALAQPPVVLFYFYFFGFKVIQVPRPYVWDCAISLLAWLSHHT